MTYWASVCVCVCVCLSICLYIVQQHIPGTLPMYVFMHFLTSLPPNLPISSLLNPPSLHRLLHTSFTQHPPPQFLPTSSSLSLHLLLPTSSSPSPYLLLHSPSSTPPPHLFLIRAQVMSTLHTVSHNAIYMLFVLGFQVYDRSHQTTLLLT